MVAAIHATASAIGEPVMPHPFLTCEDTPAWSDMQADCVEPDIRQALSVTRQTIEAIARVPIKEADFANTFIALEMATEKLSRAWGYVQHLYAVADEPQLRTVFNRILPEVSSFYAGIPLQEDLWNLLRSTAEKLQRQSSLTPVQTRLIEETLADFRDAGADLPSDKKRQLLALEQALAEKTQKYTENCLDSLNNFELLVEDPALLAGLPELARAAARQSARSRNLGSDTQPVWRFTLHAPSYLPVMEYLEDESIRRRMYMAYYEIGAKPPFDNTPLVREILSLRAQKAALLGYEYFADLALHRRMARSGRRALAFVEDLRERFSSAFHREVAELEAYQASVRQQPQEPLAPWDFAYWSQKLRQARYHFDSEALRPYFPIDQVLRGLFQLCTMLFAVQIEEVVAAKPETWHPDVKFYRMWNHDGSLLGSFYADWHPRENKRSGAWQDSLITGYQRPDGSLSPHLAVLCANLTAPVDGRPALLSHNEVLTVFHEFGHLLHQLLGEVEFRSLNGTHVAWDFVELPSQILENWAWEKDSLDLFARHHQTGATIPPDLYRNLIESRHFGAARAITRQLSFARMDLELHCHSNPVTLTDLDYYVSDLLRQYHPRSQAKPLYPIGNFGHIFGSSMGYAAGYYSYLWAEVLEADCFSRFLQDGILNPELGLKFRRTILSQGNRYPPEELFLNFMGREPDPNALLRRVGLL